LEVCSLCNDFPCKRYEDKAKIEKDSFVTCKKIFQNFDFVKNNGIKEFIKEQRERIKLLNLLLEKFNDNRSKNYYCLATALLSFDKIKELQKYIKCNKDSNIKDLKEKISEYAKEENVVLKLIKN
jgi:hypothetical protein